MFFGSYRKSESHPRLAKAHVPEILMRHGFSANFIRGAMYMSVVSNMQNSRMCYGIITGASTFILSFLNQLREAILQRDPGENRLQS